MEPEDSKPCSQGPTTGSDPEPCESSPPSSPYFPKIHSNIFPSMPMSSKWSLPFRLSNQWQSAMSNCERNRCSGNSVPLIMDLMWLDISNLHFIHLPGAISSLVFSWRFTGHPSEHMRVIQGIQLHQIPNDGTEMVPETLVSFGNLTLVMTREDFIDCSTFFTLT